MNGLLISKLLKQDRFTKRLFHGFAAPDVPIETYIKHYPAMVIMNTGLSTSPGEHWVILIIERGGLCYFFDSFARSPEFYQLLNTSLKHCEIIKYNTRQVQQNGSDVCGHHCIFFAMYYARGNSPKFILERKYKSNLAQNDHMVRRYVMKRMRKSN